MNRNAQPARDPFAFSFGGAAAIKSLAYVPAVADDKINNELARRLARPNARPVSKVVALENFLARHFGGVIPAAA